MGPLPWADLPAAEAMERAKVLVSLCVKAGYKKFHLDTSMRLGDDSRTERLPDEVIAERGAILYKVCEETYQEMKAKNPDEIFPVLVIGSEVPVPGGINEDEAEGMELTKPGDFEHTLLAYKKKFHELGMDDAWERIIAVVVQPGVEFGDVTIHHYNRADAAELCNTLKKYPYIVFKGHSTDYQSPASLKQMVEDGIAVIKVGPALTFALWEDLFALSIIKDELIDNASQRSHFRQVLEQETVSDPKNWNQYYIHGQRKGEGDQAQVQLLRPQPLTTCPALPWRTPGGSCSRTSTIWTSP